MMVVNNIVYKPR